MRLAVIIQPNYPPGRIRRFVSSLKPDTVIFVPSRGEEYKIVAAAGRARGLVVHQDQNPKHRDLDGMAILKDRDAFVPAEAKARLAGLPVALVLARVWASPKPPGTGADLLVNL